MPENDGDSTARLSLAEIMTVGLLPLQVFCLSFIVLIGINIQNPLLGLGALLFILITSSSLILLLWKAGQRENPPYWLFKNTGFWLMAVAYVAAIGVLILIAVFRMILVPSALTSPFVSDLPLIAVGVMVFMMVALVVWMAQVSLLQARRDLQHWLDTGEL